MASPPRPVARQRRPIHRWIVVLVSLLLAVGVLDWGHALHAVGATLACGHQGAAMDHEEHGSADGAEDYGPASCESCPCAQISTAPPAPEAIPRAALEWMEIAVPHPPGTLRRAFPRRLDRPPRPDCA